MINFWKHKYVKKLLPEQKLLLAYYLINFKNKRNPEFIQAHRETGLNVPFIKTYFLKFVEDRAFSIKIYFGDDNNAK